MSFTDSNTWFILLLVFALVFSALIMVTYCLRWAGGQQTVSSRIVVITAWISFVLVHSFYSGALTMFLSSDQTLPFSSAAEGLLLYPKWKLVTFPGSDIVLEIKGTNEPSLEK